MGSSLPNPPLILIKKISNSWVYLSCNNSYRSLGAGAPTTRSSSISNSISTSPPRFCRFADPWKAFPDSPGLLLLRGRPLLGESSRPSSLAGPLPSSDVSEASQRLLRSSMSSSDCSRSAAYWMSSCNASGSHKLLLVHQLRECQAEYIRGEVT
jgi:hypothetical protein